MEFTKRYYGISEAASMFGLKTSTLRFWEKEFLDLHYSDQALVLEALRTERRSEMIYLVKDEISADVLFSVNNKVKEHLVELLGYGKIAAIFTNTAPEEIVAFLDCFSRQKRLKMIKRINPEKRKEMRLSLSFPERSAGRVMSIDYILITEDFSVSETLDYIRNYDPDILPDALYEVFVVDHDHNVVGVVSILDLLKSHQETKISTLMKHDFIAVSVNDDKREVANIFNKYDLNTVPVLADNGALVGAITVDIVKYISEEENEEEILKMSGVLSDLDEDIVDTTKVRFIWLFINLITTGMASWVISFYEATIHQITALAVLMPITVSMGSNAGTQTVAVVIRAMATQQLNRNNFRLYLNKEFWMSIFNGISFSIISLLGVYILYRDIKLAAVFSVAIGITLIASVVAGVVTPIIMKTLKTDPAVTSAVFLTTVIDVVAFVSFLGLAKAFLMG
jgi:magnesium transporter